MLLLFDQTYPFTRTFKDTTSHKGKTRYKAHNSKKIGASSIVYSTF